MKESQELQKLRRLLRAGFKVQRILARAGQSASEPDSGVEITTTPQGSQAEVRYRTDAASRPDSTAPVTVTFPSDGRFAEVELAKGSVQRIVHSADKDFWDFTIAIHPSLDAQGNRVLRRFRDTGRYIDESKWLATLVLDAQKRTEHLQQSSGKVDSTLKTLLLQFLRSRDWGASRFLPLKDNFFELQHILVLETQRMLAIQQRVCAVNAKAKPYADLVDELLNALWQQDDTLLKRCMRFVSLVRFDISEAIVRAAKQRAHVDDLLGMLAKRTPMPGRQGIPHLLDAYRRYCESLRPFIDVVSDVVCEVEKLPRIAPNTGTNKRVAIIKSTRFAGIVRSLDPDIRHSESHDGTVIDDDKASVLLTDIAGDGSRRTLGEYSYWQISDVTLDLQNGLFLAVLTSFALHETGLLLTALVSPEYTAALLSIDNLAD